MDFKTLPEIKNNKGDVVDPEKFIQKKRTMNFPILYRLKAGRVDMVKIYVKDNIFTTEWGQKDGQMQTVEYEGVVKNEGSSNEKDAKTDALYQAFSHWNELQKKKGYDVDIIDIKNIFPLIPMTSHDIKKRLALKTKKFEWEKIYYLQPKLDGHRMIASFHPGTGKIHLSSRGRDEINNIKHIRKDLKKIMPDNVYLDGELYSHDLSRQKISSIVRKKKDKDPEEKKIIYYVFDCYILDNPEATYKKRNKFLLENLQETEYIKILPTYKSNGTKKDIDDYFEKMVAEKYEGIMIKFPKGKYTSGKRSAECLKMKPELEMDCLIVGYTEGTGSHKGMIIFKCITDKKKEFLSVPKWSHDERKKAFLKGDKYIGRIAVVRYYSLSDKGVPDFNNTVDVKDSIE